MPLAKKFRAMMNFPFPGDALGDFTVETVEVHVVKEEGGEIEYAGQMVLSGPGKAQDVQRAIKAFFKQRPTTFSGYGNPYQLWFRKPDIESLGAGRYAVKVKAAGVRIALEPELRRFLQYLNQVDHLTASSDPAAQDAWVDDYLKRYRSEIASHVGRYDRKLEKFRPSNL